MFRIQLSAKSKQTLIHKKEFRPTVLDLVERKLPESANHFRSFREICHPTQLSPDPHLPTQDWFRFKICDNDITPSSPNPTQLSPSPDPWLLKGYVNVKSLFSQASSTLQQKRIYLCLLRPRVFTTTFTHQNLVISMHRLWWLAKIPSRLAYSITTGTWKLASLLVVKVINWLVVRPSRDSMWLWVIQCLERVLKKNLFSIESRIAGQNARTGIRARQNRHDLLITHIYTYTKKYTSLQTFHYMEREHTRSNWIS